MSRLPQEELLQAERAAKFAADAEAAELQKLLDSVHESLRQERCVCQTKLCLVQLVPYRILSCLKEHDV